MRAVAVIASAAISGLGRGKAAYDPGRPGDPPRTALALHPDFEGLRHPLLARAPFDAARPSVDRAELLLEAVAADLANELDRVATDWRGARIGAVIGTSSGAMESIETALRLRAEGRSLPPELAEAATYFSPLRGIQRVFGEDVRTVEVLAACASSAIAIGLGCRLLEAGRYDLVIAGGYDALSRLVASGFDALRALTTTTLRPFREGRDGMALGEGAGLVALALAARASRSQGLVLGFGASSDAHHVTAPDPNGAGLERAARAALDDAGAGPSEVGLVSAHATATPFNDAAEAKALARLFGPTPVPVLPFKAVIGHTLGAASVLESLAALAALDRGCLPAIPGTSEAQSELNVYLPEATEARDVAVSLKLSAAFGGANAALLLARPGTSSRGVARPRRPVAVVRHGASVEQARPDLVRQLSRVDASILSRLDGLSELVLAAVAELLATLPERPGAGTAVVVGTVSATLEQDELFDARRRAGLAVEPRRFPATSPNLPAGWCGIAFGFEGPAFAVGGERAATDALAVAAELVAAGDAERAIAVAVEDAGDVVRALFEAAGRSVPRRGARAALLAPAERPDVALPALSWALPV